MAFNPEDLYTVSGGVTLYNYWNPFVTKHDASSFYSWEQDNLPSHDLEERTYYLWEKFGYPTSSLPGMALAVSATIPDIAASSNVFTSLQDAIEALPEIIRMPTLIEVAVSGDIGTLHLDNVKCVGTGALEIINRVYAPINQSSPDTYVTSYDIGAGTSLEASEFTLSSVLATGAVERLISTSALSLSANTWHLWPASGTVDGAVPAGGGSFAVEQVSHNGYRGDNVCVSMHDGSSFVLRSGDSGGSPNPTYEFNVQDLKNPGAIGYTQEATIDFHLSSFDLFSYQSHLRRTKSKNFAAGSPEVPEAGINSKVNGLITNNRLRSIKVSNCDGPIYIRGFIVDAASGMGSTYTNISDWGIKVNNTEGLVLEECGVARAYNGGLLVNNSNIVLNRKFFSGRNYQADSTAARYSTESCGIKALNSTITLSSNDAFSTGKDAVFACYQHHYGIELRNSTIDGGSTGTELKTCYNMSAGIRMRNSNIEMDGVLDVYSNRVGIDSIDSGLTFDRFICQYNKEAGIKARNSHIYYGKNSFDAANQDATGALLIADLDAIPYDQGCGYFGNGKHLDLTNSYYEPVIREDMVGTHRNNIFYGCNGSKKPFTETYLMGQSGIVLHNSKADFLNTRMAQGRCGLGSQNVYSLDYNFADYIPLPTEGVLVNANSNSNVSFIGTRFNPTILTGDVATTNKNNTGVYASNNSTIKFSGPTAVYHFGTGVHVDSGSVLDVSPQTENGILDFSSYSLSNGGNHTSFEVHSYNSCIAATNNSTIKLRDLGNARNRYPSDSTPFLYSDLSGYDNTVSSFINSGGCVFIPNNSRYVRTPGNNSTFQTHFNPELDPAGANFTPGQLNNNPYNYFVAGDTFLTDDVGGVGPTSLWASHFSTGGIAVMATDNSVVDVVNVCFHTNSRNKNDVVLNNHEPVSPGGTECDHLIIWAFARGSSLHAAHLAVSGAYPSEAGYHGPEATYWSGTDYSSSSVLYTLSSQNNLVSGLPDTSTLSVLDFFGSGVQMSAGTFVNGDLPGQDNLKLAAGWSKLRFGASLGYRYGCSSFENSGPFRLYFDTESHARNLIYQEGNGQQAGGFTFQQNDNRPWQTMAQGYMLSGSCSSVDISNPVSIGDSFIFFKNYGSNTLQTSGYYHTKDAVKTDCNILLDESAANTFANAKHCSMVTSERPKLVDIYKSTTTKSGDFFSDLGISWGQGIRTQRIYDPRRIN